jgi:hypothetical protein
MERYNVDLHFERNWRSRPIALDYDIRPLWSIWVTKEEALEAEKWFKDTYPKTFFSEVEYNGITECRDWAPQQSYAFMNFLNKKFPKDNNYWQRIEALRASSDLYGTNEKIYYIMLTKK